MEEITIAQAAERLGVSMDTIRRRISKGEIKARKVPSAHGEMYLVELPEDAAPEPAAPREKTDNKGEVEALHQTISILETELEARRREVQELHVLLQQAQAALPPGRGAAAKNPLWRRLIPWRRPKTIPFRT
jgi:excisionase family DNA binding protein